MAPKESLGTDVRGVYRRYIGWKLSDGKVSQHLFRLGKDEERAGLANVRLEKLWSAVVARWERLSAARHTDDQRPLWDAVTLAIGATIAQGKADCAVSLPAEMANLPVEMRVAH